MVDRSEAELLKETFDVEYFPTILFLKDGKFYEYYTS